MESLNARHTVQEILEEPLVIHGMGSASDRRKEVNRLLDLVGLPKRSATRFPFEVLVVNGKNWNCSSDRVKT